MREDAESEVAEDDALTEPEDEQDTIGQEMQRRGLNDEVLRLQTHSSHLVLDPPIHTVNPHLPGDFIRQGGMRHIEEWLGFEFINLPATSNSCGTPCDFCTQMRPDDSEDWALPCCRLKHHHILNNPIGGTRIPLDVHYCHECLDDYITLQVGVQFEPGYFTDTEEGTIDIVIPDDSSDPPETDDDVYASSFERWYNQLRRNRRNRRSESIRSPNDDRDDVDGSENTASEEDVGNFPVQGPPRDEASDEDDSEPEPSAKRVRLSEEEAATAGPSSSSSSMPRLVDAAAAVPCAAATPLSLSSHPLYQQRNTNDQQNEDSNRDDAPASARGGSPFQ